MAALLALLMALLLCGCGREEERTVVVVVPEQGDEEPAKPAESPQPAKLPTDWYGWWTIDKCSGDWDGLDGSWWDCCAELTRKGDSWSLTIWDEDLPKDKYLAKLSLKRTVDGFSCAAGQLMDKKLKADGCSLSISGEDDSMKLYIRGALEITDKSGFSYSFAMRPWGELWEEAEDQRPGGYESWYLPLIEDDKPMPDKLGK